MRPQGRVAGLSEFADQDAAQPGPVIRFHQRDPLTPSLSVSDVYRRRESRGRSGKRENASQVCALGSRPTRTTEGEESPFPSLGAAGERQGLGGEEGVATRARPACPSPAHGLVRPQSWAPRLHPNAVLQTPPMPNGCRIQGKSIPGKSPDGRGWRRARAQLRVAGQSGVLVGQRHGHTPGSPFSDQVICGARYKT